MCSRNLTFKINETHQSLINWVPALREAFTREPVLMIYRGGRRKTGGANLTGPLTILLGHVYEGLPLSQLQGMDIQITFSGFKVLVL